MVPARNEADVIQRSLASLLAQDYPGDFRIILVDDQTDDGTGERARALNNSRLTVLTGAPRPPGWTGKLWAMSQGVEQAGAARNSSGSPTPISPTARTICRRLVARAEDGNKVLVSLMARLSLPHRGRAFPDPGLCLLFRHAVSVRRGQRSQFADRGRGRRLHAGAARAALEAAGGIAAIRHNIIDDCALARAMKAQGPIWLGLTDRAVSLRPYEHIADIRHMVARSRLCPARTIRR